MYVYIIYMYIYIYVCIYITYNIYIYIYNQYSDFLELRSEALTDAAMRR